MDFRSGSGVGAKAPTPVTVRLAPQCADLPQLVERPAFVGFHCTGGSSVEQDSPAEPKMVARAALLVENGPGPAKSRRAAKSRHLTTAQPRLQGQKISRTNHPGGRVKFPGASRLGPGGGRLIGPTVHQGGRPITCAGHIPTDASYLSIYLSRVKPLAPASISKVLPSAVGWWPGWRAGFSGRVTICQEKLRLRRCDMPTLKSQPDSE